MSSVYCDTLESKVCVQLLSQWQANQQTYPPTPPHLYPLPPQIKSQLFLYCGGLLPAMSLSSLLQLNCWFLFLMQFPILTFLREPYS